MATVYGDSVWGITAETGMYAQSFDFDLNIDEEWLPDEDGDEVAGALFNEKGTFTLNGFEKSSGFPAVLGASITLANAIDSDDFISGDASGATTICTGLKRSRGSRAHRAVDCSGVYKPFLGALQV
jgi:hypothetical protein